MPVIGLTGNIGSGKSTVARHLEKLGAKVVDADRIAREVVQPGSEALAEIARAFGPGYINRDGSLNRQKMAKAVFSDPGALSRLNAITHPRIKDVIIREIENHKAKARSQPCEPALVIDAPLLIETGLHRYVDEVWVVKADESALLQRAAARDRTGTEEARRRLGTQMPQEDKLKYATRVIDNSKSLSYTLEQVEKHWRDFLQSFSGKD